MTKRIHRLDANIAAAIRSHVSISSTTVAIKGLVENSFDATASEIEVNVVFDKNSILILDTGSGISPDDMELVAEAHCTSKGSRNDANGGNYGYRGEFLQSLSNVSHLTIISKTAGQEARIKGSDGAIKTLSETDFVLKSLPSHSKSLLEWILKENGTIIWADKFFYNLPVRRKKLAAEPVSKIFHQCRFDLFRYQINSSSAAVQFYKIDGKSERRLMVRSSGVSETLPFHVKVKHCYESIYGSTVWPKNAEDISVSYKGQRVEGVLALVPKDLAELTVVLLNKRLRDEEHGLEKGISKQFSSKMQKISNPYHSAQKLGLSLRYSPFFVLRCSSVKLQCSANLTLFHSLAIKTIEKFLSFKLQESSAYDTLETSSPVFGQVSHEFSTPSPISPNCRRSHFCSEGQQTKKRRKICANYHSKSSAKDTTVKFETTKQTLLLHPLLKPETYYSSDTSSRLRQRGSSDAYDTSVITREELRSCSVVGQVDRKFILLRSALSRRTSDNKIMILDQHAADERVRYEEYLERYISDSVSSFSRNLATFYFRTSLSIVHAQLVEEFIREFQVWGINIHISTSPEERDALLIVSSLPDFLERKVRKDASFLEAGLYKYAEDLRTGRKTKATETCPQIGSTKDLKVDWWKLEAAIPDMILQALKSKACRSAIKFDDFLTSSECQIITESLARCHSPFCCAHGRPSVVPVVSLADAGYFYAGTSSKSENL
ncbi:LAMI_0F04038g1_1 [Lachancea mirantina]|uniref:LAMI_0F04038g1_1 n=1 Tax=Lachancea mirantina TaxID=1230905 RepID=A0A1G4JXS4_9SACH|nr:LAMI_0F04038g1_1 [Lachancea mirantina]